MSQKFKRNSELKVTSKWEQLIIDHWFDYLNKILTEKWEKPSICTRTYLLVSIQINHSKLHDFKLYNL